MDHDPGGAEAQHRRTDDGEREVMLELGPEKFGEQDLEQQARRADDEQTNQNCVTAKHGDLPHPVQPGSAGPSPIQPPPHPQWPMARAFSAMASCLTFLPEVTLM
jgi:hypothetical protein